MPQKPRSECGLEKSIYLEISLHLSLGTCARQCDSPPDKLLSVSIENSPLGRAAGMRMPHSLAREPPGGTGEMPTAPEPRVHFWKMKQEDRFPSRTRVALKDEKHTRQQRTIPGSGSLRKPRGRGHQQKVGDGIRAPEHTDCLAPGPCFVRGRLLTPRYPRTQRMERYMSNALSTPAVASSGLCLRPGAGGRTSTAGLW